MYERVSKLQHQNFSVEENGLFINPQWPYIGASPDSIVCCHCCGRGALEIKCPYCHRGKSNDFAASHNQKYCLKEANENCSWTLTICTNNKFKLSCLCVMSSIVIFVYAHLLALLVSQLCILSTYTKNS